MSGLALSFLGPPRVLLDGAPVELKRRKPLALLAYLAVTAQTHARDVLTEMLYPGLPREQAFSDFRQTLTVLRQRIGEEWLITDRIGVGLRDGKDLWVDAKDFRRLIEAAKSRETSGGSTGSEKSLSQAAALVRGMFLAGFSVKDSPEFEDWQSAEGESLRRDQVWVLERLVELHQSREEYREAIEPCRTWLSLDSLEETVHCRLMRLYALAGQRSLALKQYERCRIILEKELGEKPGREIVELRDQIARRSLQPPRTRKAAPTTAVSPAQSDPFAIPFVGRGLELGRLKAAAEEAGSGKGRMVMLVGEAGIGKTRLIEEAAIHARAGGARVIWGRCYEDAGLPPFWPWRQALGQLVRESGTDSVRRWAGRRAAILGEIIDELSDKLGTLAAPVRLDDPESERFRLAEAVAHFLDAAAQERHLTIVLDDLHCADGGTLKLLEFVSRGLGRARILVFAACRNVETYPGHALGRTLGELARERCFERIELGALGREQVAEMAERCADPVLPAGFSDALWERTRGNPLFVVESLRYGRTETVQHGGDAETPVRVLPVPPSVRALIRGQLLGVSRGCCELLETAAALGAEFTTEILSRVTDLSRQMLLARLDEAVRARFLFEPHGRSGSMHFSHPLMQETIAADLTESRRTELHANVGLALEEFYGEERESHAIELARHFGLAQALVPVEKLIRYSLLAGEQAFRDKDYEEALRHFQKGLAAKGLGADDAELAWLRFGLARALVPQPGIYTLVQGDQAKSSALAALNRAFDYFVRSGDTESSVRIAEHPVLFRRPRGKGSISMLDKALTLVRPGSIEAGRLLRLKALNDYSSDGNYAAASKLLQKALKVAIRHKDRLLTLRVAASWADVSAEFQPREVATEKVQCALKLLREVDDPRGGFLVRLRAYHGELGAGRLTAAETQVQAALAAAVRLRSAFHLKMALLAKVELAWVQGDWDAARAASDQALAEESHLEIHLQHLRVRARMEFELGAVEAGTKYLERYVVQIRRADFDRDWDNAMSAIELAQISMLTGDTTLLDLARSAAASVIEPGRDDESQGGLWFRMKARMGLALVAAIQADRETAERVRVWLASERGIWIPGLHPTKPRLLGLLDLTLGDAAGAVPELEQALADYAAQRPGPNFAWTTSELAEALLARGGHGDRQRASELLREGLAMATTLGMVPLQERCRQPAMRVPVPTRSDRSARAPKAN